MKFVIIRFLYIVLPLFLYAPHVNATEDVDWISGKEPIYETGTDSPVVGTRWGIATRKGEVQISFRLEVSTDMKNGGWIGDIRAPEKFYVKLYLIDSVGNKQYIKLRDAKAIGPDAIYGGWKTGPATTNPQMMMFNFSWEEILRVKNANAIVLGYSSYDSKDDITDITIPLDAFNARLGELETSIKSVGGASRFLMTQIEINNTPVNKLPTIIREHWKKSLKDVSNNLSVPMSELSKLSMIEIQVLQENRAKAKLEEIRKAHEAIYDQKPKWFDINICPKPDVSYCSNVGKTAYLESSMSEVEGKKFATAMTLGYGDVFGVVWRSKGSIVKIYPGDVKWNNDPRISRAPKAEYYYILKNGNHMQIKPSAEIYAKD